MMVLGSVIAASCGVIGLYLSFYLSIASGAAIVLTCTAVFGLVWAVQTVRQRKNA
jgi:manganese/iron transport system permease protein